MLYTFLYTASFFAHAFLVLHNCISITYNTHVRYNVANDINHVVSFTRIEKWFASILWSKEP